jgi:acid stress-induced BolA-like protein IbaG/YrbA
MDALARKIEQILKKGFPSQSSLNIRNDNGIIGVLVSAEFEGLEAIDRQNKIWEVLESSLSPEEQRQIQIIVAATPEEQLQEGVVVQS